MEVLYRIGGGEWTHVALEAAETSISALEMGKILYLPELRFSMSEAEKRFLSPAFLDPKAKNISFDPCTGTIQATSARGADREQLLAMIRRFSDQAGVLVRALCPGYRGSLVQGLTSFRPAEIAGRASTWRKDDTRLHVDAFPSRPNHGRRILRLFSNVNASEPRVWRAGEPFGNAARTLLPGIKPPFPGSGWLLGALKITKGRRSLYDHYMLGLHDAMKADLGYQKDAPQTEISFAPGSTWICFTDCVSHAAMSGQYLFEQTFYLPVDAMENPSLAPLRVLEKQLAKVLI